MKTLTKKQVLALHSALIQEFGGMDGVRNEGLLESALAAPFQTFGGEPMYPSLQSKAAQLGFGLIRNHPFVDGNKRIGAMPCWCSSLSTGLSCAMSSESSSIRFSPSPQVKQTARSFCDGFWNMKAEGPL